MSPISAAQARRIIAAARRTGELPPATVGGDCLIIRPIRAPAAPAGTLVPLIPLDF